MAKEVKAAAAFRLGAEYRRKLKEIAEYQNESQTEIFKRMINVTHRAMNKRKKLLEQRREARRAAAQEDQSAPL